MPDPAPNPASASSANPAAGNGGNPNPAAGQSPADAKPDPAAVQKLVQAAHEAYTLNPGNCSGAVHYVITKLVDPDAKYLLANQLMDTISKKDSGWRKVTLDEAGQLASQGKVVVGGLAAPGGHGHVIVVLPGLKAAGGYNGIKPNGSYPMAMSTSLAHWAGAISDDTKTVRDPWSRSDWPNVTFWTPQ
jgi:hypothetical protein